MVSERRFDPNQGAPLCPLLAFRPQGRELEATMANLTEATSLRILISGDDAHSDHPLHETIVRASREAHLAGAKVTRGVTGYGRSGHIHETWRGLSYDLPVVVEIIDTDEKIKAFLPTLELLRSGALVTRRRVQVLAPPDPATAA